MALNEMLGIYTMNAPENRNQPSDAVLPEWENTTLGEISQIRTGPFGTLLKASEYSDLDGVPMISVREVGHGRLRVDEHTPLIPREVVKRLPEYLLREGDVIFGRKGAVDRSALVSKDEEGWFLGSDGIRVRLKDGFHPPFFAAQFQSRSVQQWLLQNATGTTMASLNQEVLGRVRLHVPPFYEQNAIATALKDIDDLIASLDALIAKKRDIKQAAMQQLLTGKTRLPGFEGEWLRVPVGSLGKWRGGATPSMRRREFWEGGNIPWASSADVRIGPIESTSSAITERAVRESSTTLLPPGSIAIVTRSGILRRFLPVGLTTRPTAINQDIKAVFPNPQFSSEFVFHALVAASDEILASCLKSGTTVESIEFPWLKRFEIEVPEDRAEQDAISLLLTEMDQEVDALTAKQAKAAELKDGMMQQLLTGRIRLV